MLEMSRLILGPVETNTYILADGDSGAAVVIDPAWDGKAIALEAKKKGWRIAQVWVTHAHFDHIGGIKSLLETLSIPAVIACHPADMLLWNEGGLAPFFGLSIDLPRKPDHLLVHGEILHLGNFDFEVRQVPGHSPGHVVYYCKTEGLLFSGDVIFLGSVGRTDLPDANAELLLSGIRSQVLSLPDETRIFPGHGPATTIAAERHTNPYLTYFA